MPLLQGTSNSTNERCPRRPQPRPPCAHMTHHGTLEGSCPVVLLFQPKRKTNRGKKTRKKKKTLAGVGPQHSTNDGKLLIDSWTGSASIHTILWSSNNLSSRKGRHCNGMSTLKKNHGKNARATWMVHQLILACFKVLDLPKWIIATSNKSGVGKVVRFKNMVQISVKRKKHLETWFKL